MIYYSVFRPPSTLSLPVAVECDSFEDICAGLTNPETYPNKQAQPGIKLATFNGKRNNDNLVGFSGIELDYDDGKLRPEEVSATLSSHGIKHFIYTTGSHQPFKPRFRVLVPFSDLYTIDVRNEIMNELAYLLNDSFAAESRTESQFYYYGQVEGVMYETFYGAGEFIDELEFEIPSLVVVPKTLTPKSVDHDASIPYYTLQDALLHVPGADRYPEWQAVGQALKCLGDTGLELWLEWSRRSYKHDEDACLQKWDMLKGERTGYQSVFNKAKREGWQNTGDHPKDGLAKIEWKSTSNKRSIVSMSTNGDIAELEKSLSEEVYVIDEIALRGDLTVIYAASNSGKTLLTIHSLIETVKSGRIKGEDIFYINADDNLRRYVEKMKLLIPHNIQCLMPGRNGFDIDGLIPVLNEMREAGELNGKVLILDTLTKFTNLMEKNKSRDFVRALRELTLLAGLTVIMLAHTNKTRGLDGKPIPEGTGDMKNNVDTVYVVDAVKSEDGETNFVTFNNVKSRGSNSEVVKFKFEKNKESTYQTIFDSVVKISHNDGETTHRSAEYSQFDLDSVMSEIESHAGGMTLQDITKFATSSGVKNAKKIVEDNLHLFQRIGNLFKLRSEVQNE